MQEVEKDMSLLGLHCCKKPVFHRTGTKLQPESVYPHRSIVQALKMILSVDNVAKLFLYQLERGPGLLQLVGARGG